jgi:hypothetical protein
MRVLCRTIKLFVALSQKTGFVQCNSADRIFRQVNKTLLYFYCVFCIRFSSLIAVNCFSHNCVIDTYFDTALRNEGFDSSYIGPGMNCDTSKFNWTEINLFEHDFKSNVNFPAIRNFCFCFLFFWCD